MVTPPPKPPLQFGLRGLLVAVALVAAGAFLARWSVDGLRPIPWQDFSLAAVQRENSQGRDVLVSFTADWDTTAMLIHYLVNKPEVGRVLRRKGVMAMRADCTVVGPEISTTLSALGRSTVPLIVIYPASGKSPIIFDNPVGATDAVVAALLAL